MRADEYLNIFELENEYWWYKSLRDFLLTILSANAFFHDPQAFILDAGCGTGGALLCCSKVYPQGKAIGMDIMPEALFYCRKRGLKSLFRGSVENLPFANNSLDAIISLDVLYHLDVKDDEKALKEAYRALKKGGKLLLHLPAFEFLKGGHDLVVHTRERYNRAKLYEKIKESGFKVTKCTYRYAFFFPALFLKRLRDRFMREEKKDSDLKKMPDFLNRLFYFISHCENRITVNHDIPFGSSIFCIGE